MNVNPRIFIIINSIYLFKSAVHKRAFRAFKQI